MASRFEDKFNEDLELILAKYSNPFNGAPELTLSTCDWPENVQVIENYKYSNCGKWKVLERDFDGLHSCDEGNDETSDGDYLYSSDEENQTSCYDSDDSSDCSESLKMETSFREKYPRSCAKQGLKTPLFNCKLKESTNAAKTPPNNHKLAYKQYYYEPNKKQTSRRSYTNDEYFKPKETISISKDLWSQVQHCLHLMTSVFSQLNCKSDNEKDSKKRHSHSIRKCSVKQRLFHDTKTSSVPQGVVVEKLFVRHKGSSAPAVELGSRQTFMPDTNSKISEIESLDSGFCQEDNVSASTQQYSSSSSSRMGGSTSHKTIVFQKKEGRNCAELSRLKSSVPNSSMKSAAGLKQLPSGVSCSNSLSCPQPSTELSPKIFDERHPAEKKRRRRYRLVRRRSTSCRTRVGSSNETSTSEHESDARENQHFVKSELYPCTPTGTSENESDTREIRHVVKNEHSFDQCLSDNEDLHVPEKTKITAVKDIKQNECCSSPKTYHHASSVVHDKVLSPREIPRKKTLSLSTSSHENGHTPTSHLHRQTRSLIPELSQGYCHSSTPRKHIKRTVVNSPEAYLKSPFFQQDSGKSAESMPSPIRSTLNTNETLINNTFLGNTNQQTLSSQPQNKKKSLPSPISSKLPGTILQPEISVNFLRTKDILKRRSSCNERPTESNIRSGQNDGYTKKRFPNKSKKVYSANTLQSHSPSDNFSEQSTEQDYVSNKGDNKRGNLMPNIVRSSNSTSTRSPAVQIRRAEPLSEPDCCRSKSRNVLRATTDKRAVNPPLTQTDNSESSASTESSITRCERKSEVRTPKKLNSHNSDSFTTPNNKQLKIPPRRVKFHPYSTCGKFPRTPSLISPLRDLTIKSPRHKWTTLDRSPMAVCVKQARRMSDPVVASRTILEFGSHDQCSDGSDKEKTKCRDEREPGEIKNEHSLQYRRKKLKMKRNNEVDCHVEDNESKCSNGKCTKIFCFNCSMMDLS